MAAALNGELVRHWKSSLMLMMGGLAGSIAISNERGVFIPVSDLTAAIAMTARALAAEGVEPDQVRLGTYDIRTPGGGFVTRALPQAFVARLLDPTGPTPGGSAGQQLAQNTATGNPLIVPATDGLPQGPVGGNTGGTNNSGGGGGGGGGGTPGGGIGPNTGAGGGGGGGGGIGAVPEPASWLMMIMGFGIIGALQRRLRQARASGPGRTAR